VAGERVSDVARLGLAAAWRANERLAARLVVMVWFIAVAVLPRRLAVPLIALRFVPASRPAFLGAALRRLGALRAQGPLPLRSRGACGSVGRSPPSPDAASD